MVALAAGLASCSGARPLSLANAYGPPVVLYGDVNGDGRVDLLDVAATLRLALAPGAAPTPARRAADVWPNPGSGPDGLGDGRVDANDARQILRYVLGLISVFQFAPPPPVTTLAGPPVPPNAVPWPKSLGLSPMLGPWMLAVDSQGNAFATDFDGNNVWTIPASGRPILLAGIGLPGYKDGPAAVSRFAAPAGIAVDAAGNVYVGDQGNNCIRRIDPQGRVTTVAGSRRAGFADGSGAVARFHAPLGLRVDAGGSLYVADSDNDAIRKIDPQGNVTTIAGGNPTDPNPHHRAGYRDGPAVQALFHTPSDVELAPDGSIYVADSDNQVIRRISRQGWVSTVAGDPVLLPDGNVRGGYLNGPANAARFDEPYAIALDRLGNLWVDDWGNERIRVVTPTARVLTIAGSIPGDAAQNLASVVGYWNARGRNARFFCPMGVAVAPNGDVLVADTDNQSIRRIQRTWW